MASLVEALPDFSETFSAVGAEVVLFGLAVLLYSFFSGRRLPTKTLCSKGAPHGVCKVDGTPLSHERARIVRRSAVNGSASHPQKKSSLPAAESLNSTSKQKVLQHMRVIRNFGKDGKLAEALEHSVEAIRLMGPDVLLFNATLDACVHNANTTKAVELLEQATDAGAADVVSFNIVIKGHVADGRSDRARQLLSEMARRGLPASLVTFHSLLNAAVQAGNRREAWRIVDEIKTSGLTPNAVTCSILLKGMNSHQHGGDVERIVELIDTSETKFDEVLFTSVAEACIRSQRLDLLSAKIASYRERGLLHGLAAPTFGSMIKAFGLARNVDQIRLLWAEMMEKSVQPTPITLGCMIEALVTNRCTDEAYGIVQRIQNDESQRHLLNTVIYSTILKGYAFAKRSDKLMDLYAEMKRFEIPCNTITYNTMLNAFAQTGVLDAVPHLLQDMKCCDPPVEPDIVTYTTLVKCFCAVGDIDQAFNLLQQMEEDGRITPDEVMYNSLLDGCAKQHRSEDAWKLLKRMSAAGIVPSNYTLSIMVKLLGRSKKLNQAFQLVKDLSDKHGFQANVQVYTCLMQACFHNRQPKRACEVHDRLVWEGCRPDQKTYTVLVTGLLHAGQTERAVDAVRCAHHLQGHSLQQPEGAPGVSPACLKELIYNLGAGSSMAKQLQAELAAFRSQRHRH